MSINIIQKIQQASSSTSVSFPQCISHYTPNRNIYSQCRCTRKEHYTPNSNIQPQRISQYTPNCYIHAQLNSNYTPNHNIHPQCNRLCLERLYRSCVVPCLLFFYSHKKWWKTSCKSHLNMKSDCGGANTYGGCHSDVGCSRMTVHRTDFS